MTDAFIEKPPMRRRGPRASTFIFMFVVLAMLMAGGIVALQHFHVGAAKGQDYITGAMSCDTAFGIDSLLSSKPTHKAAGDAGHAGAASDAGDAAVKDIPPPGALACVTLRLRWDGNQAVVTHANIATPEVQTDEIPTGEAYRGDRCASGLLRVPRASDLGSGFCHAILAVAGDRLKLDTGLVGYSIVRRRGYGAYDFVPLGIVASGPYSFAGMTAVAANSTGSVRVTTVNGVIRLVFRTSEGHRFELGSEPGKAGHVVLLRYYLVPGPAAPHVNT